MSDMERQSAEKRGIVEGKKNLRSANKPINALATLE
jgi:hypothetical protein